MTYPGPWRSDGSLPTDHLVDTRDSATPGSGTTSFTWGSTSQSTDQPASTAAKMSQAWTGTGPSAPFSGSGRFTTGIVVAESFFGPRGVYEPLWLTMQHPTITNASGRLTPEKGAEIDSTPGVVALEWEPTALHAENIVVRAYNMSTVFAGRSMPVKFVDGVSLPRWEPPFESADVMNARSSVATIVPTVSGGLASGEVAITVTPSGAAFAVSVVDPFTAAQDISGLGFDSYGAFFSVSLTYTFVAQRYRLIYEGDPPPGAPRVPPLRLFPRSDGRGASSAQRVWPRPPTAGYGRVGPGSLV